MKTIPSITGRRGWKPATRQIWLFLVFLHAVGQIMAQPANDAFADRISLTGPALTVTGNNQYATLEASEPALGEKTVWWSWTAPTSGVYTVTAVGLPGCFYPYLGVYNGATLENLTLLASDTFTGLNCTYAARVVINATGGMDYPIAVSTVAGQGGGLCLSIGCTVPPTVSITSPTNNATCYVGQPVMLGANATDSDGTVTNVEFYVDFVPIGSRTCEPYQLNVAFTNGPANRRLQVRATDNWGVTTVSSEIWFLVTYPPPVNDTFANRFRLAGAKVLATGNNQYATLEAGEPTQGDKTIWWAWKAPTSGVYTVTAVGLPGYFYPYLGVYTGTTLKNLTLLASDSFTGLNSTYGARVVISAIGGVPYLIAVSTVAGQGGGLTLCIAPPVPVGEPARFDSITRLADGSWRLVFRTGASSIWGLETSTDLSAWEGTCIQYLSQGTYEIHDFRDAAGPGRFYRLRAEP